MKTDIDKALQKCQSLDQMREVILDMCIHYLWNDYIFEDDQDTKSKVREYALTYSSNRMKLDENIMDITTQMKKY